MREVYKNFIFLILVTGSVLVLLCFILAYRKLTPCVSNGMGAFHNTAEETKWDSDNKCIYKIYNMSEMAG